MTPDEAGELIRKHTARASRANKGPWFVQPNDLIGGICIRDDNSPPSYGKGRTLAEVTSPDDAQLIVLARDVLLPLTEVLVEIVQMCELAEVENAGTASFVETEALKNVIEKWVKL